MRNSKLVCLLYIAVACASCTKDVMVSDDNFQVLRIPKQDRGFIVIAKEGENVETISNALAKLGSKRFVIRDVIRDLNLIHVQTPDPDFAERARTVSGVEDVAIDLVSQWAKPEKVYKIGKNELKAARASQRSNASAPAVDNNPLSFLQWGLESINARKAWERGYQGNGAKVAVLDGGFLLNDYEISPNIILSHSFIDSEEVQYHGEEGFSHGTHVAGIIAALNDDDGIVGVAPKAKLMLVKVLTDEGSGPWSAVINGIYYATVNGADVINMSLGAELPRRNYIDDNGTPDDPSDDMLIRYDKEVKQLVKAMDRATFFAFSRGTTVVAAAGNDAFNYDVEKNFITYPGASKGVICIAANGPLGWGINQDTTLYVPSIFTNTGKNFVSYGAPGGNYSIPLNTQVVQVGFVVNYEYVFDLVFSIGGIDESTGELFYVWVPGTSMAAPHASAVAALLYGKYGRRASPLLVDYYLNKSAWDKGPRGKDRFFGEGQINAGKAVSY